MGKTEKKQPTINTIDVIKTLIDETFLNEITNWSKAIFEIIRENYVKDQFENIFACFITFKLYTLKKIKELNIPENDLKSSNTNQWFMIRIQQVEEYYELLRSEIHSNKTNTTLINNFKKSIMYRFGILEMEFISNIHELIGIRNKKTKSNY